MRIRLKAAKLFRPATISMVAVAVSFCAWLFPSFGFLRKGFSVAEHIDLTSFLVLSAWYLLIFICFSMGQKIGGGLLTSSFSRENSESLDSNRIYYLYTAFSTAGALYTFGKILSLLSLRDIIIYIGLSQANMLKYTLYSDYSVGLTSFRYLVVYSTSLAIYKIVKTRKLRVIHIFNVLLMLLVALISTRLIFVATLLITLFISNFDKTSFRLNFKKTSIFAGLIFFILSVFNYSRNANSYARDNLSFAGAGISEIITYLGSPFQVAIGGAKITDLLTTGGGETYRSYVDVSPALNTNSAFIGLHEMMGYTAWLYIACVCFSIGFLFSYMFSLGRSAFLLPCGAILYGSAELWRVDLFEAGIFLTWLMMGIGVPLLLLCLSALRDRWRYGISSESDVMRAQNKS